MSETADGSVSATCLSTEEGVADLLAKGLLKCSDDHTDMIHSYTIIADDWESAMTEYHRANGWEAYRPL
jgi:hypothetical protein